MHRATIFLQDFFTIDNTRPLAIIFFHQNKRPSPIKGPLLKIRLQDPLNVLRENSSPVHYWCAYGILLITSFFNLLCIIMYVESTHISFMGYNHGLLYAQCIALHCTCYVFRIVSVMLNFENREYLKATLKTISPISSISYTLQNC